MGREITAQVTFRGVIAEAKVLLEGQELILRGGHQARIARGVLRQVAATADGLAMEAAGQPLRIGMPADQAARWAAAIAKPAPSLADKLGLSAKRRAHVIGSMRDPALEDAVAGFTAAATADAAMLVAELSNLDQLPSLIALVQASGLPLWCVHPKGKGASPGDTDIRLTMRAAGLIDSKTCSVSGRLTATRYGVAKMRSV